MGFPARSPAAAERFAEACQNSCRVASSAKRSGSTRPPLSNHRSTDRQARATTRSTVASVIPTGTKR
jgi:plasmid stabilization system protein ParE